MLIKEKKSTSSAIRATRASVSLLGLCVGMVGTVDIARADDTHYVSINDGGVPSDNYNNDGATGNHATAIGVNADASGNSSTAVGINSQATNNSTTAIGDNARAFGATSTAIGWSSKADRVDATAVGSNAEADGDRSSAFGFQSKATANNSLAMGVNAQASGNSSTAVGVNSLATNNSTTAVGDNAQALGATSTAIGWSAKAGKVDATAVGSNAEADGERSTAFGFQSKAVTNDSLAFGSGAIAGTNAGDVALGAGSVTGVVTATTGTTINGLSYGFAGTAPASMLSVGSLGHERVIANLAAGQISATSTDAVNGSQLHATNQAVETLGGQVANNTTNITNLQQSISNGTIGLVQQTGGSNGAITVGGATGGTSIDVSGTSGPRTVSGVAAGVAATDAVNVAQLESAILAASSGGIKYDDASQKSVTFNNGGSATTLANVAAGNVSATSSDAVNGSQLYATNQVVSALATGTAGAFQSNNSSGRADPNASGADSVAGGFGAVASGARSTALGSGATSSGTNSVALGYNSSDGGLSNVVSVGSVGGERQIVNVAAGTRTTDAVNVGQLNNALVQANGYTNAQIAAVRFDMSKLRNHADAGTASAMAAAGLPQAYSAGKGMVAGSMGVYRDRTAFAIGASKAFNDGHTVIKGGATYTSYGSTFGANVGIGYQF